MPRSNTLIWRATMAVVTWVLLISTSIDDRLGAALGLHTYRETWNATEFVTLMVWVVVATFCPWPHPSPALVVYRYFSQPAVPEGIVPSIHVAAAYPEDTQQKLDALRTLSSSHKSAESYADLLQGQRDRLIVEIAQTTSLTLREIAPWAGMSFTRVGKIIHKPIPENRGLLLTPEIPDWNFVTPDEVTQFLTTHYDNNPPPSNEEIQALLDEHAALVPTLEGQAPAWPWWMAQTYDVFGRAISNRSSLHLLEVLGVARVMMLSATWRAAATGKHQAPDLVERGMNLATRLLVQITAEVEPG